MRNTALPCLALALAAGLAAPQARAVEVVKYYAMHAPAHCQSTLPAQDLSLRRRPLALANESAQTVFVACSFENLPDASEKVMGFELAFRNRTAISREVKCTMVQGWGDIFTSPFSIVSRNVNVRANSSARFYFSPATETFGIPFTLPAVSCALPPGVDITGTRLEVLEWFPD